MSFLRTPDECFRELPGHPFEPHYALISSPHGGALRMHYVDEGPPDAAPVLLCHGEPTWSYLYRKMIPVLVDAGLRVVAPDHIGFGRSDKLTDKTDYTFRRHVGWIRELVERLDLRGLTFFGQDWGGPTGLGILPDQADRFARIVLGNTMLHSVESSLAGKIEWANHLTADGDMCVHPALLDWILASQRMPDMVASASVAAATHATQSDAELAAYDAPFPDARYKAGMVQFPALIPVTPSDPGVAINLASWKALAAFERPLLTVYGDSDPPTRGWDRVFQARVPGAKGQPHTTLERAGHFLQEDRGEDLAHIIADFVRNT